jgi:hypothetical protein
MLKWKETEEQPRLRMGIGRLLLRKIMRKRKYLLRKIITSREIIKQIGKKAVENWKVEGRRRGGGRSPRRSLCQFPGIVHGGA